MRSTQIALIAVLAVLGVYVAQPYVDRMLFSATTPRPIEPRGNLSELERSTIELFERVSPSVVQVVAHRGGEACRPRARAAGSRRERALSGTRPATSSPTTTWCRAPTRSGSAFHPAR